MFHREGPMVSFLAFEAKKTDDPKQVSNYPRKIKNLFKTMHINISTDKIRVKSMP